MSTHTPGPWSIHQLSNDEVRSCYDSHGDEFTYRNIYVGSGEKVIAEALMRTARNGGWPRVNNVEEQDANVRLFIAAPDLLAALKAMVASYDGIRDTLTCKTVIAKLAKADEAIAKAEGAK